MDDDRAEELLAEFKSLESQVVVLAAQVKRLEESVGVLLSIWQQGRGMARLIRWIVVILGLVGLGTVGHKLADGINWLQKP